MLVASSGLHANGASLARLVAGRLADGWATRLPSGATFGEALLEPSTMYVPLVAAALERGVGLTYISHVTGHGLLKLMRPPKALTYRIERLPDVPEVLAFLVEQAGLDAHAAYSTFNMGSGYALYCPAGGGEQLVEHRRRARHAGAAGGARRAGPASGSARAVGVRFEDAELELSAG